MPHRTTRSIVIERMTPPLVVVILIAGILYGLNSVPFRAWHLVGWVLWVLSGMLTSGPISVRARKRAEWRGREAWRRDQRYQSVYRSADESWLDPEKEDPRRWVSMGGRSAYAIPDLIMIGSDRIIWRDESGCEYETPGILTIQSDGNMDWFPTGPTCRRHISAA